MRVPADLGVVFALVLAGSFLSAEGSYKSFRGHKVYGLTPTTDKHLDLWRTVERQNRNGVLFWSSARTLDSRVDVMVAAEQESELLRALREYGIPYKIVIEDVQNLIDNENPEIEFPKYGTQRRTDVGLSQGTTRSLDWTAYHRLDTIYSWLDELAQTYPQWVKILDIGRSYEGRRIKGVSIIFNKKNPGILVEGGLHAREWISPATVTYLINEILSGTNESFQEVARAHNWYILPINNPDGYEYTHTTNRLWRKTRKPYANNCTGADPNRNWDFKWMANDGASNDSCDEDYAGPEPFSEVEVRAFSDYIALIADKIYMFISMHSYGQQILLSYGYTPEHLGNYNESMTVAKTAAAALSVRYGTHYQVGTTYDILYTDSGTSTDYVKGVYGTRFVYCYEMRDKRRGLYGFILPADQIIPNALEIIDSLAVLIREAQKLEKSTRN